MNISVNVDGGFECFGVVECDLEESTEYKIGIGIGPGLGGKVVRQQNQ